MIVLSTLLAFWWLDSQPGFMHPVASAPVVVQAMNDRYGWELGIGDDELHRCMVLVHAPRTPREEILEHLADLCLARWEPTDSGRVLRLDRAAYAAQEQADRAHIRERIVAWQQELREMLPAQAGASRSHAESRVLSPHHRFRLRFYAGLDPDVLVQALISEEQVSFENRPEADLPYPVYLPEIYEQYVREWNQLVASTRAIEREFYDDIYFVSQSGLPDPKPSGPLMLVVGSHSINLWWNMATAAETEMWGSPWGWELFPELYPVEAGLPPLAFPPSFQLSRLALFQKELFGPVLDDLGHIRLRPLMGTEPLDLLPGDYLRIAADAKQRDIIAVVPDESLGQILKAYAESQDDELAFSRLTAMFELAAMDHGWLLRPRLSWLAYQDRWDRRFGQQAFYELSPFGDEMANLRAEVVANHGHVGRSRGFRAVREHLEIDTLRHDPDGSAIYALLEPALRESMMDRPIPFTNLPREIQQIMQRSICKTRYFDFYLPDYEPGSQKDPFHRHRRVTEATVRLEVKDTWEYPGGFEEAFLYPPPGWTEDIRHAEVYYFILEWPNGDTETFWHQAIFDRPPKPEIYSD